MDCVGRVVAQLLEVVAGEDVQHLDQCGALAPGPAGKDLGVAEPAAYRLLDPDAEPREVLERHPSAFGFLPLDDAPRDVAPV